MISEFASAYEQKNTYLGYINVSKEDDKVVIYLDFEFRIWNRLMLQYVDLLKHLTKCRELNQSL
ncbi:MAG TPA: hypothetical protein DCW90_12265 [Lachnospiraceae bacterium]|nr:hypothetical protein [uncultured Lachnoclostridium sp.]HAU86228.1 hypothetical protein [Lachnospiraceae bacterium]